ncbi:LysE family translocator [Larsenimonas rhizosphaerae]|uniref:LysE family transporter n=1 Tax=Larsenimonas rhizosphaerae TaxID=2944682 RepID=A0AA42CUY3_9GAMM|nr:LysE family transporter [Larsenimonas rhizosphaerae]MCM2129788.1 LysE family transporter [Larsenimonas rhizosphaerae]MCX2524451.1 LysE family transporter [Larsenimonas rhizosphaerae]
MEIVLYALTVMYTPGPVNLLGLNAGLTSRFKEVWGFFAGVALAIFCWFAVIGYAGQQLIVQGLMPWIALAGSAYILYLAWTVFRATPPDTVKEHPAPRALGFRDGLLMQLLNPKNTLLVVPITTVMFPGRGITDTSLVLWSLAISLGGGGAPALYLAAGKGIGARITETRYIRRCNSVMAGLLVVVALLMLCDYVILPVL